MVFVALDVLENRFFEGKPPGIQNRVDKRVSGSKFHFGGASRFRTRARDSKERDSVSFGSNASLMSEHKVKQPFYRIFKGFPEKKTEKHQQRS